VAVLEELNPQKVFYFFEEISKIPRGSGNEKVVSDYILHYAQEKGFYCRQDEANNVFIKKPGTKGYEHSPAVILQGHIDMVCEKNMDTRHDFLTDGLELVIKDDFISANGTTLGADNGIAAAYMLAVLDSEDLEHPPIEAIFTTDEEVGMKGAHAFDPYDVTGKRLINMDTEEEGHFIVSCCGGKRATLSLPLEREDIPKDTRAYSIQIKGLKGGHSGADIHLQRANANKLMGRVLYHLIHQYPIRIASIDGGLMDNAISREAEAIIVCTDGEAMEIQKKLQEFEQVFRQEHRSNDGEITITCHTISEKVMKAFTPDVAKRAVDILMLIPYGVETMSMEMAGLVESSSNIGIVKTEEDAIFFHNALRSNIESKKQFIYEKMLCIADLTGAEITSTAEYPAWEWRQESPLLELFRETYRKMYGKEAKVEAIHAGLECGLFKNKISDLDVISFGPDMFDVHTPDERLSISSTRRMWEFLKEVLRGMKE
jgi:dipeptidase D